MIGMAQVTDFMEDDVLDAGSRSLDQAEIERKASRARHAAPAPIHEADDHPGMLFRPEMNPATGGFHDTPELNSRLRAIPAQQRGFRLCTRSAVPEMHNQPISRDVHPCLRSLQHFQPISASEIFMRLPAQELARRPCAGVPAEPLELAADPRRPPPHPRPHQIRRASCGRAHDHRKIWTHLDAEGSPTRGMDQPVADRLPSEPDGLAHEFRRPCVRGQDRSLPG